MIIDLPKRSTGTDANVPLRGVERQATQVREHFKIIAGRAFEPGKNEVMVGAGASASSPALTSARPSASGRAEWLVVGAFTAGGGAAESEIWADAAVLQQVYQRGDSFQSVSVKLASPARSINSRTP